MKDFKLLRGKQIELDDEILDPSLPSYYNTAPNFNCVGVTPRKFNPHTLNPYRYLVYENIQTGWMTTGELIEYGHPMWDYNRQINPDFYNSHYIERNRTPTDLYGDLVRASQEINSHITRLNNETI